MPLLIKCFFILFLLVFSTSTSFCQLENFIQYRTEEGLPSSQVYEIIEDDLGYLWFLTDKGISRYDGYEFENFSSADGLSDDVFFEAQKNTDGTIWILGFNSTLTKIRPETLEFTAYQFNDTITKYINRNEIPKDFFIEENIVYISFYSKMNFLKISNSGIVLELPKPFNYWGSSYSYLSHSGLFYQADSLLEKGDYLADSIRRICSDYDFGFSLNNGLIKLFFYSKDSISISYEDKRFNIIENNFLKGGAINDSIFWVSSEYGGVKFYSVITGELINHFLDGESITDIVCDNYGDFWLSTLNSGVFQSKKVCINEYDGLKDLNKDISGLIKDKKGQIFIAHNNGNISKIYGGKTDIVYNSLIHKPASIALIDDIVCFSSDRYLFTYMEHVFTNKILGQSVNKICKLDDNIGFCHCNGYSFLDENDQYTIKHPFFRINDGISAFNVNWFATNSGLMFENHTNDSVLLEHSHLFSSRVNVLVKFNTFLVLGTNGEGIVISTKDSIVQSINGKDLSSDYVNNLYVENDSILWVSTNLGLTRLLFHSGGSEFSSTFINKKQGLGSLEVSSVLVSNDTVWMGTKDGLYFMNNTYFNHEPKVVDYQLQFKEILINDLLINNNESIELPYYKNKLTINYTAVLFDWPSRILYRYKLAGLNNEWVYSKNRDVIYSNLPPNKYEFILQVKGENEGWEEGAKKIMITIFPPFWKTWWFIIAFTSTLFLLIYLFFRFKILLYNRDLVRELLRHFLKKIRKEGLSITVKEGNKEVKIFCKTISYVESDGNYIKIYHSKGKTIIRHKISGFLNLVPDPIEYIQVRRSFIVRIDKIDKKSKNEVFVSGQKIQVGSTYLDALDKISL